MQKLVVASACAVLLSASSIVAAAGNGLTWDYLSASWVISGKIDEIFDTANVDGYEFRAVKSLSSNAFFGVRANQWSVSESGIPFDLDFSTSQIGVGGHYPLGASTDLWGSIDYNRVTLEGFAGTALGATVGVRSLVTNELELSASYKFTHDVDFGQFDGDALKGWDYGATWIVNPSTAVTLTVTDWKFSIDPVDIKYKNVIALGVRLAY